MNALDISDKHGQGWTVRVETFESILVEDDESTIVDAECTEAGVGDGE